MINSRKRILISFIILVLSILTVAAAVFVYQIKTKLDKMIIPESSLIESAIDSKQYPSKREDQPISEDGDFYVLLMGLDHRDGHDALLTDTLMVMHIIPSEAIIKLLSIPRDLLVKNVHGKNVKINSMFYEGYILSREKTQQDPSILTGDIVSLGSTKLDKAELSGAMANTRHTIEELLDLNIDHMILVNLDTLKRLVDEVGGIEIDVKRSMKYKETNLYLEPGLQLLDGDKALGYARFRQDDRGPRYFISDFERGNNQQDVVKALASKILSWKNSTKALRLLDIISDSVKTDLDYYEMYSMVKYSYSIFKSNSFVSIKFPEYYNQEGEVIIPDEALKDLRRAFQEVNIREDNQP